MFQFNKLSGRIIREAFKRRADECDVLLDTLPDTCLDYWSGENPPLVVISLDGFRPDYLEKKINASGIQEPAARLLNLLSRCGVFAPNGMTPVFPSLTFPNHYSIVTGLYPESHGIVGNSFYDPDLNASFSLSSPQQTNSMWWIGDPLWHTAKDQVRCHSALEQLPFKVKFFKLRQLLILFISRARLPLRISGQVRIKLIQFEHQITGSTMV